jgi:DNA-binding PadR family transcriptional regulator
MATNIGKTTTSDLALAKIVTVRLYMPSVLDHIVLALICEKPQHGFAISKELDADESLVTVLKVRRPLVYRSINSLEAAGLIKPTKTEAGVQGSERTVYSSTSRGKAESSGWLNSIVDHPRDARIELLAKFVLRGRSNMSNTSLAKRQRELFSTFAKDFKVRERSADPNTKLVARWRYESINAMIRLLDSVIKG